MLFSLLTTTKYSFVLFANVGTDLLVTASSKREDTRVVLYMRLINLRFTSETKLEIRLESVQIRCVADFSHMFYSEVKNYSKFQICTDADVELFFYRFRNLMQARACHHRFL